MRFLIPILCVISFSGYSQNIQPAVSVNELENIIASDLAKLMFFKSKCNADVNLTDEHIVELVRVKSISEGFFSVESVNRERVKTLADSNYRLLNDENNVSYCQVLINELGDNVLFVTHPDLTQSVNTLEVNTELEKQRYSFEP